MVQTRDPR